MIPSICSARKGTFIEMESRLAVSWGPGRGAGGTGTDWLQMALWWKLYPWVAVVLA